MPGPGHWPQRPHPWPRPGPGPWRPFPGPSGPYFPPPTIGYNPFPLPYSLNYPYIYPSSVVVGLNTGASLGDVCYSTNVQGVGSNCVGGTVCAPTNVVTDARGQTLFQGQCRLGDNVVLY